MNKIVKAAEEILEKMSFGDYKKPKNPKEALAGEKERRNIKKNKLTLYLTEEELLMFNDIYINRLKKFKKTDRSALFAEAVKLLHEKEFS